MELINTCIIKILNIINYNYYHFDSNYIIFYTSDFISF